MSTPSDLFRRPRAAQAAAAVLFFAAALVCGLPALAAPAPQEAAAAPPAAAATSAATSDRAELRQQVERRYEVLPIRDGLLLKPRKEKDGVRAVEIRGASVAVNGEPVNERVLRAWLGEAEADPVLRLAALDRAAQRTLFGLESPAGATPAAPAVDAQDEVEADVEAEVDADAALPEAPEPPDAPEPPEAEVPEVPAPPAPPRRGEGGAIKVAGSVTVDPDEVAEEVVAFFGPARVKGEVIGDVTAIAGAVYIDGKVGGSVTSVGSSVHLGPKSIVEGDVTSVGGRVRRSPGARVDGSVSEVSDDRVVSDGDGIRVPGFGPAFVSVGDFVGAVFYTMLLALLCCLAVLLVREPLERVERKIATDFWGSLGAGVGAFILFLPMLVIVTILLIVTIVGCLVVALYPVLALVWLLGMVLGYAGFVLRTGRWLEGRFGWRLGSPYLQVLVGVGAIQVIPLLGYLFGIGGGPLDVIAGLLLFTGFLIQLVAWVTGLGALLLTRFGLGPRPPRSLNGLGLPPAPPPPAPHPPAPGEAPPPAYPVPPAPPIESREDDRT